jgi:TolB-like protein
MADRVNDQLRGYLSDISLLHVVAHDATRHVEMASSGSIRWSKSGPHYTVAGYLDEQDGKVRLRVDLIDAGNNVQVWSRTFEYTSGEFPSRQDDLARQLAYAVHVEAVGREGTHLPDRVEELSTSQLVAGGWAILIGGVWGQLRHGHAGKVFDEALRREPLCTAAMVGLAGTKLLRASNLIGDRDQQMAQAEALLRTAQLRGQTDFSTYFYLGILHNLQSNLPAALQAYDRALEINPSFAPA